MRGGRGGLTSCNILHIIIPQQHKYVVWVLAHLVPPPKCHEAQSTIGFSNTNTLNFSAAHFNTNINKAPKGVRPPTNDGHAKTEATALGASSAHFLQQAEVGSARVCG